MIRAVLVAATIAASATSCHAPTAKEPPGVTTGTCEYAHMSCGCDDYGHVTWVRPENPTNRAVAAKDCRWLQDGYDKLQSAANNP